jgi:transposase
VVEVLITGGNAHDITVADKLVAEVFNCRLLADKGYTSEDFRAVLYGQNNEGHIPPKSNAVNPKSYDKDLYKLRKNIELTFGKLK